MFELFSEIDGREAELSPDGVYRYTLTREWADGKCVCWLCFNPSTANATEDDHSIRKMIGFSKRWGYGRMVVINLYALRSRDPGAIGRTDASAIGPLNNYWITESIKESREVICAWGCADRISSISERISAVLKLIGETDPQLPLTCLGYRKDGHPRHPLMLPYDTLREEFNPKIHS
jgi:hypothetical protein